MINHYPPFIEVENYLKKLRSNILETGRLFWRWKDGTCIFCEPGKGPNDEPIQKHTYYD